MATYNELATIPGEAGWDAFMGKVITAVRVKSAAVIDQASPTAAAVEWAQEALIDGQAAANNLVWYIIAVNKSASVAVILAANDSSVQNNIDDAVIAIYGAGS